MKRTRQQAINEHCKQCIYDTHCKGTWRMQTEACTINTCPLYPYRPKSASRRQSKGDKLSEAQTPYQTKLPLK